MDTLETLLNKTVAGMTRKPRPKSYEVTCQEVYKWDGRSHILEEIQEYQIATGAKIDFVDKVNCYIDDKGKITAAQYNALVKIYYTYGVDAFEAGRKSK